MPLVSVYITNYNYEKYLEQSIHSVLNQTMQDFELFIIDDGSVDRSREIIERYRGDPRIKIVFQQNKGLNATNNVAMNMASGKYFMRLDADDFVDTRALEIMTGVMEADPDLGLIFPDYYYIDGDGHITGEERRHDFERDVSLYDQPAHGACTMVRLEYLRRLGGYNEMFTCQDGYELWIKFVLNHKVNNVNEPLFYYRRHGNNLTTNEERILSTRRNIKSDYIASRKIRLPDTAVFIPVRKTMIDGANWPLFRYQNTTVLEHAIATASMASNVQWVVVSSADDEILKELDAIRGYDKLHIVKRPSAYERVHESLNKTFDLSLQDLAANAKYPQAIMSISLEYPNVTSAIIDDAVNTLTLFGGDSLLSVRPDNRMYYQHIGHGMVPILDQDKFTKFEREALYKGAGGIVISTLSNYRRNRRMVSGKVGHIVVDQQVAFGVFGEFDLRLFKAVNAN